jgi:hypothetical protein
MNIYHQTKNLVVFVASCLCNLLSSAECVWKSFFLGGLVAETVDVIIIIRRKIKHFDMIVKQKNVRKRMK